MKYIIEMPEGWKPRECNTCPLFTNRKCGPSEDCPLSHAVPVDEPKDCGFTLATCPYERCSGITKRADKVEPLACLADKKETFISMIQGDNYNKANWYIRICWKLRTHKVVAPTYAECEALARAWLVRLEDKKGGE